MSPVAAGLAWTWTVQAAPEARLPVPQVSASKVKSVVLLREGAKQPLMPEGLKLVRVKVCADEFDPATTMPKLLASGLQTGETGLPVTVI